MFIYALDISSYEPIHGKAQEIVVKEDPVSGDITIEPTLPESTFRFTDKNGDQRVIDLELLVKNNVNGIVTNYVHLSISERFFTEQVKDKMKIAIGKFFTDDITSFAINTGTDVDKHEELGFVYNYGHATKAHLNLRVFKAEEPFGEENPVLGIPCLLNGYGVPIEGDVLLDSTLEWKRTKTSEHGWIYDYPAISRNRFQEGDMVVVNNVLAESIYVRESPGGPRIDEVEVPNGTTGVVREGPVKAQNIDNENYYVWWLVEYSDITGWCASLSLDRAEEPPQPGNLIFQDDFESYAVGTFPYAGGWSRLGAPGNGEHFEFITDERANSGIKSLRLESSYWSGSGVGKLFDPPSTKVAIEGFLNTTNGASVYIGSEGGATAAVRISSNGTIWARNCDEWFSLGKYVFNTWIKVRVELDLADDLSFNVLIDDVLSGRFPLDCIDIDRIAFNSAGGGTYGGSVTFFDDVAVYDISAE